MSRCVNLNHARANASAKAAGLSRKFLEIFSYTGSNLKDKSVVSMVGNCFLLASNASGTVAAAFLATHCWAPAGLFVNSHSLPKRVLKKPCPHFVGVAVQVTSKPEVMASLPFPDL